MLQMFKNNTVGVSRSHQKDKHGAIEWSWCSPIHFWSVFVVQIRFEGFCQFCQIYERNQLKINTWRSLQMAFTKKSLGISVQNNVQLSLIVSPKFMKQLPSVFFCCHGWNRRYHQKSTKSQIEGWVSKNICSFWKYSKSGSVRCLSFFKNYKYFSKFNPQIGFRGFLVITAITTVATKKTRPKNSNASWRNNQDKWNIILNRNP